jgi:hypothetical protein
VTAIQDLREELSRLGIFGDVRPADPPYARVESLNVFTNAAARYPNTTVWAPRDDADTWTWGPSFEHSAPAYTPAADLANRVVGTLR